MKNHQPRPDWNSTTPTKSSQRNKAKAKHQQKEQQRHQEGR